MALSDIPLPKFTEARRQRVLAVLDTLNVSPTAVNVPMRILQLQQSKTAGLADFGKALQADAALASKVLATVNSSFFSPPVPVTRISDAVRMIGLNNLLPLVFGLSLAGIFNPTDLPPSDRATLWRTALLKGIVARERARMLGETERHEEAFLCGLFQDIALPAILASDRAAALELSIVLDIEERAVRERALFGSDHAEFGARLLKRMGLPAMYVDAVASHHELDELQPGDADSCKFGWPDRLRAANQLAAAVPHRVTKNPDGGNYRGEKMRKCFIGGNEPTETASAEFYNFVGRVNTQYERLCAQLGDNDDASPAFKQFLQQVCDQVAQSMTAAIGESARTIISLSAAQVSMQSRMIELETQVQAGDIDPLTEAFNRRGFFKRAERVFSLAREYRWGTLVGFVDLDNFKKINDCHGHEGGDEALKAIARSLRLALHEHGVVGRSGGDEFILAASCSADQKPALCLAIADAMSSLSLSLPDGTHKPVTASCGIAWTETLTPNDDIDTALKRADELMYEVKRGGKARCVIRPYRVAA